MLPKVVIHNAVSVDGRIDWFHADIGKFYELASHWQEDATLAGSNTMLAAEEQLSEKNEQVFDSEEDLADQRPLLVVPDSRGRLNKWHLLRKTPYWRDVIALCSRSTPQDFLDSLKKKNIDCIITGDDHVDLRKALEELNARYGVKLVRVDSGGVLNGILLRAGLVDEVSVLIHPSLVGGISSRSIYRVPDLSSSDDVVNLKLIHIEQLKNDLVWLRYEVARRKEMSEERSDRVKA